MRREAGPFVIILLVALFAGFREPRFLHAESLSNVLLWVPTLAIVGFGQMLVIVTRGIDVSVGSVVGFSAMCLGLLFKSHPGMNLAIGAAAALAAGALLGCVNGTLIAGAKVPPIITTLGGLSAYRGLIFIVSKSKQVDSNDLPDALSKLSSNGLVLKGVTFPWTLFATVGLALIVAYLCRCTKFGRDCYAIGGNPDAAALRGIPIRRVVFGVYALTGLLAGVGGIVYASRFGFINPSSAGEGLELSVIAAVVIGGTRVTGGVGSVLGVLLGSLLLGMLNVALAVLGISEEFQALVYGSIILVALLLDTGVQRWAGPRWAARA